MSLAVLPAEISQLQIVLPNAVHAAPGQDRSIYFETSREGVADRQGEDIAADALWNSRKLFLSQGNFDIWHLSWLKQDPSFVIGVPSDVQRSGPSIFVKGHIFAPTTPEPAPVHSSLWWANLFWGSQTQMYPPMPWFPSVLGNANTEGTVVQTRKGREVRFMKGPIEWYSVGFAPRVQHPGLPPISKAPVGPFADPTLIAKAHHPLILEGGKIAAMSYSVFAKAVQTAAGLASNDSALAGKAALSGIPAIRREALEGGSLKARYKRRKKKVLGKLLRGEVLGELGDVAECFRKCGGLTREEARCCALQLGEELDNLVLG